jgi:hypothetical protein
VTRVVAPAVLLRFGLGVVVVIAAGLAAFRLAIFDSSVPAFHVVTIGPLLAALLALARSDRIGSAVGVAALFALGRLGFASSEGWAGPLASVALVAGALVTSVLFDALARYGIRFGKFLVLGPLLAGLYVAVTPLAEFGQLVGSELQVTLLRWAFLGVLIGDSTGLGVELADLLATRQASPRVESVTEPDAKRALQESPP